MSGKKAKAIRKSAKREGIPKGLTRSQTDEILRGIAKSLAGEDSGKFTFANPRISEVSLSNIRCFADEQRVPIRPITLLVGENSAGKTTFLGAYSMFHRLAMGASGSEATQAATFNAPPFHMGAFRDIVRSRSGGRGGASQFKLGGAVPFNLCDGSNDTIRVVYTFRESGPEPFVSEASLSFAGGERVDIVRKNNPNNPDNLPQEVQVVARDIRVNRWITSGHMMPVSEILSALTQAEGMGREWTAMIGFADGIGEKSPVLRDILLRNFRASKNDAEEWGAFVRVRSLLESRVVAFAPARAEPKRTYDPEAVAFSPSGGHIPMLMAELSRANKKAWEWLRARLVEFGRESGLFADFRVKGLGHQPNDPFQIQVKAAGKVSNIVDVGHGVSQIFPLLVQILRTIQTRERCAFLLQDPETNLHPQAQAALASFFAKSAKNNGHTFFIETHGDSVIDRVRICVSNGIIPPEDVVILYFEPQPRGNVKIHPIWLDEMSNMRGAPKGYRDFFVKEDDLLLGFKKLPKGRSRVRHR